MKHTIKNIFLAAALVVSPVAASALTTSMSSSITGSSSCDTAGGNDAYQVDVLSGAYFSAQFAGTEAGGVFCFDLVNSLDTAIAVTVVGATVNQLGDTYGFTDGVSLYTPPAANTVWAQGVGAFESFTFYIAAASSIIFDWTYGAAYASGESGPSIDFSLSASPVPVPAAGFLLLGALGGLGVARRRRRKAT